MSKIEYLSDAYFGQLREVDRLIEDLRDHPLKDQRAQDLKERWLENAWTVSDEVSNKISELWITKILDCNERTVELFREDAINDEIGLKHAGVVDYQADSRAFWEEVNRIAPQLAPNDDLQYLIENDNNGSTAWTMIFALDSVNITTDLTKLIINYLRYKKLAK